MKQQDGFFLRLRLEIDKQVTAGDHVEPGERGIGQHVLHREDDERAQLGRYPPDILLLQEKPAEAVGRDALHARRGICGLTGGRYRICIDVRREQLQPDRTLGSGDLLLDQHSQGVDFLSGATTRNPDPKWDFGRVLPHHVGDDALGEVGEHGWIAEETSDMDHQVFRQQIQLPTVLLQQPDIAGHLVGRHAGHCHPSLSPAL